MLASLVSVGNKKYGPRSDEVLRHALAAHHLLSHPCALLAFSAARHVCPRLFPRRRRFFDFVVVVVDHG